MQDNLEYKQTELGLIPEDWEITFLGNLGTFSKGAGVRKDQSNTGSIPCVRYGEIYTKHHDYIKQFYSFISEEVSKDATRLKTGDILFAGSGETKTEIGKSVAFIDDFEAYAGGDLVIFSPRNVDSLFLGYLSNAPIVQNQKAKRGQGDAVVHISSNQLSSILIPLPPLPEQIAIASALSDMDALIAQTEKLIEKKKAIKQGVMQELLFGKRRLVGFAKKEGYKQTEVGLIPEDWEILQSSTICDVRDGTHDSPKYHDKGVPLVTSKNIVNNDLDLTDVSYVSEFDANEINKRSKVDKGDILMSMIGTIGNAVIVKNEPEFCIKNIALFKPKRVSSSFFYQLIISPIYKQYINSKLDGGIQKFISLGVLRSLLIIYPPLPEQEAIANALSDMDTEICVAETKLQKLKLQKQGMMQALLTGKIRLV